MRRVNEDATASDAGSTTVQDAVLSFTPAPVFRPADRAAGPTPPEPVAEAAVGATMYFGFVFIHAVTSPDSTDATAALQSSTCTSATITAL